MSKDRGQAFRGTRRRRSRVALVLALGAPLLGMGLLAIGLATGAAARTVDLGDHGASGAASRALVDSVVGRSGTADRMRLAGRPLLGRKAGTTKASIAKA